MIVLGINAYHGDASVAVFVDGRLVAAIEEERFSRIKHTAGFPTKSIRYCLEAVGARLRDVDHLAIARDPRARLLRKLLFAARLPRFAFERARVARRLGRVTDEVAAALDTDPAEFRGRVHRVEHHHAHLASAFFVSPFDRAALLSLDGLGDFGSGMWGIGTGNRLHVTGDMAFPHSLGLYYTAVTQYLGFAKYGDEHKVMGLAAYGEPEFLEDFRQIVKGDGRTGCRLDLTYFTHHRTGPSMTWHAGEPVLGPLYSSEFVRRFGPEREIDATVGRHHENIAATLQARLEEVVLDKVCALHVETGLDQLAYSGGVAFNCVANGKALVQAPFQRVYVPPAAGDAGLAVGAATYVWHHVLGHPREFVMEHAYWGPEYEDSHIRRSLEARGLSGVRLDPAGLAARTAREVAGGKIVGRFGGRTEWGPRALGNRSILADPRRADMRDVLNNRVKQREPFRPFAPSVLEEHLSEWFEGTHPSPFMLFAYRVRTGQRERIPATTHVDGTARVQTVSRNTNQAYWDLIAEFQKLTDVPVVLNTSFNENEPVVNTPEEALECFLRTRLDVLAMGPYLIQRSAST